MGFIFSKFLPAVVKQILPSDDFSWTVIIFSKTSAWTGSHVRETLISRTLLFLPHDIPPTKKSSTIKS
jgi:hypothetical protein